MKLSKTMYEIKKREMEKVEKKISMWAKHIDGLRKKVKEIWQCSVCQNYFIDEKPSKEIHSNSELGYKLVCANCQDPHYHLIQLHAPSKEKIKDFEQWTRDNRCSDYIQFDYELNYNKNHKAECKQCHFDMIRFYDENKNLLFVIDYSGGFRIVAHTQMNMGDSDADFVFKVKKRK